MKEDSMKIYLPKLIDCNTCGGMGWKKYEDWKFKCNDCDGTGKVFDLNGNIEKIISVRDE